MDAFKLLTRSINLPRKSIYIPNAQQAPPSQGATTNPQLFGSSKENSGGNGLNKKRKRQEKEKEVVKEDNLPTELDFFGVQTNGVPKSHDDSTSKEPVQKLKPRDRIGTKKTEPPEGDVEVLDEENCRRILKEHKIKITELWAPAPPVIEDTSGSDKKKRKRVKEASKPQESSKKKKRKLDIIPQPLTSFSQLLPRYDMSEKLLANLGAQGYTIPTEVQLGSLPLLCDARHGGLAEDAVEKVAGHEKYGPNIDLLTVAPTGSGKTLAFLIPVLNAIMQRSRSQRSGDDMAGRSHRYEGVQTVIVAPTKELASQIVNEGRKLTLNTGIKVALVRKGMEIATSDDHHERKSDDDLASEDEADHEDADKPGKQPATKAQVLVSTPLTLVHAIGEVAETLSSVRYLILDEADVLLDPLFREQTLKIWTACSNPELRVSLWSATMGASIEALALSTLDDRYSTTTTSSSPSSTSRRHPLIRLVVGLKDSAIPNVHHHLLYAGNEAGKLLALRQLLRPSSTTTSPSATPSIRPPFLVFTQTIPRAIALHSELLYDIPPEAGGATRIAVLHSDLSDSARAAVMTAVRKGEVWVLITTDLLSRGVDFKGVNGVVNYDFPQSSAVYVHRVGRTGRAGREGGVAVTLYAKEDIPFVRNVANVIAASEKQQQQQQQQEGGGGGGVVSEGSAARRRLLESLPTPSKRDKQMLKKRGVESRRTEKGKDGGNAATRISTKSGYQRRLENNRKGAVMRSRANPEASAASRAGVMSKATGSDDDFSGFDDEA